MPRFTVARRDSVTEIVFDDGGMNLLSSDALRELHDAVRHADGSTLRFRSGRPGLFAAGADMAEMQRFTPAEAYEFSAVGQELFDRIERLPCLTVAVIDGDCFGGALDLALAFDVRFASARSRFSHPGAKLGIATGFGGTTRWRKVIGRPAANALFLGNDVLTADDALRIGLIDSIGERPLDVDPMQVRLVKELTMHSAALSRSQLLLLAERLGHLYFRR
jgi:enoyl-CoA hydratase